MQRLFIAIRPPRPIRDQLRLAMGGVAGARWQSDKQLHITLRFIGEVACPEAEDVSLSLQSIHRAPFEISLDGVAASIGAASPRSCGRASPRRNP